MDYNVFQKAPLFSGMKVDDIALVLASTPFRIRNYRSGAMISRSGEPVNGFMMVITGTVKGEMVDYSGRLIKIEDIPAMGALASAFIFGDRNRFPVNVIAVSDTSVMIIDKPDFIRFLKNDDRLLINFLDMISNRSQFLSEKIKFLSFKTIRGKFAQYVLQNAGSDKIEIRLGMTQNELAEYFGVARPSIARVIGELESEGIIITKGRSLTIKDRKKLAELTTE